MLLEQQYPRLRNKIIEAKQEGYTDEEIRRYISAKIKEAQKEGYSISEINQYLQSPSFTQRPFVARHPLLWAAGQTALSLPQAITELGTEAFYGAIPGARALAEYLASKGPLGRKAIEQLRLPILPAEPVTPEWQRIVAEMVGAALPIAGVGRFIAKPIEFAVRKAKYLRPFARLIGWGVAGTVYDTARKMLDEGELPTPKEMAASGAIWASIEGALASLGYLGRFAFAVNKYAKLRNIPRKQALSEIIHEAKKYGIKVEKFAKYKAKAEELRPVVDKTGQDLARRLTEQAEVMAKIKPEVVKPAKIKPKAEAKLETKPVTEVKPKIKPTKKEPWEMTAEEFSKIYITKAPVFSTIKEARKVAEELNQKYGDVFRVKDKRVVPKPFGHETIVKQAIKEGKSVPDEVLKDYPDIKPTKINVILRNIKDKKEAERIAKQKKGFVEPDELNVGAYKVVKKPKEPVEIKAKLEEPTEAVFEETSQDALKVGDYVKTTWRGKEYSGVIEKINPQEWAKKTRGRLIAVDLRTPEGKIVGLPWTARAKYLVRKKTAKPSPPTTQIDIKTETAKLEDIKPTLKLQRKDKKPPSLVKITPTAEGNILKVSPKALEDVRNTLKTLPEKDPDKVIFEALEGKITYEIVKEPEALQTFNKRLQKGYTLNFLGFGDIAQAGSKFIRDIKNHFKKKGSIIKEDKIKVIDDIPDDLGFIRRYIGSPENIKGKEAEKVKKLVEDGIEREMAVQRGIYTYRKKLAELQEGLSQKEIEDFVAIRWTGDAEGKIYTAKELREQFGANDKIIEAYNKYQRLVDMAHRQLRFHERDMQPTLRKRYNTLKKRIKVLDEDTEEYKIVQAEIENLENRLKRRIPYRKGYVPHIHTGSWRIYLGDEPLVFEGVTLYDTPAAARKAAQKYLKQNPDADISIGPKIFQFPFESDATQVTMKSYHRFVSNLEKKLKLSREEAYEFTRGVIKPKFRRRIFNHIRHRYDYPGYMKDLIRASEIYFSQLQRYIHMDRLKYDGINLLERMPKSNLKEWTQKYLDDVLGIPSDVEKTIDIAITKLVRMVPILRDYVDTNFATRRLTGGMLSTMAHLKLGFGNISSAVVNLSQTALNSWSKLGTKYTSIGIRHAIKPTVLEKKLMERAGIKLIMPKYEAGTTVLNRSTFDRMSLFFFNKAEDANKAVAFLGKYHQLKDAGYSAAKAFKEAKKFMLETQFYYGLAGRPEVLRHVLLRVPLQFKTFMIKELEFVLGLRGKEIPRFLAALTATGGIIGIPGALAFDAIVHGLTSRIPGIDPISPLDILKKQALKSGGIVKDIVLHGFLPGLVGVDMSRRIGMCVDEDTECLTKNGWKRYNDIKLGEEIWSYNPYKQKGEWLPILNIYKEQYQGKMIEINNRRLKTLLTPNHKCLILAGRNKNHEIVTAEDLLTIFVNDLRIPRGFTLEPIRNKNKKLIKPAQEDLIYELLGLWITDGSWSSHGNHPTISQSKPEIKHIISHLVKILGEEGKDYVIHKRDKNKIKGANYSSWIYVLKGNLKKKLLSIQSDKRLSEKLINKLNTHQKLFLILGLLEGDGSIRRGQKKLIRRKSNPESLRHFIKNNWNAFNSTDEKTLDLFQMLAISVGIPVKKNKNNGTIRIAQRDYVCLADKNGMRPIKKIDYEGIVWCPTIKTGFWFARSNGSVFITGNSDFIPTELEDLQGPFIGTIRQLDNLLQKDEFLDAITAITPQAGRAIEAFRIHKRGGIIRLPYQRGRPMYVATPYEMTLKALNFMPVREAEMRMVAKIIARKERDIQKGLNNRIDKIIDSLEDREKALKAKKELIEFARKHGVPLSAAQKSLNYAIEQHNRSMIERHLRTLPKYLRREAKDLYAIAGGAR